MCMTVAPRLESSPRPLYAAGRPQVDGAVRRLSLLEDVFASAEIVVVDLCPDLSPQPGQRFG